MSLLRRNALVFAALTTVPACGVFVGIKELEVEAVADSGLAEAAQPDASDAAPPVFEASVPETYVPPVIDAGCKILSKGPLEPKTISQDSENGPGWERLDDGKTADDKTTGSNAMLGPEITKTIRFTGYDVTVPPTARVFGVKAEMRARASLNGYFADKSIMLTLGGQKVGADLAVPTNWTTTFESRVYGGDTNPWGLDALTPAIVNQRDFGIAYKLQRVPTLNVGFPVAHNFGIDVVAVTVFYCE